MSAILKKNGGELLGDLKEFINMGELLPHGTQLVDVSSDGVIFRDGLGADIQVEQLSDGYRSILSCPRGSTSPPTLARKHPPDAHTHPSSLYCAWRRARFFFKARNTSLNWGSGSGSTRGADGVPCT